MSAHNSPARSAPSLLPRATLQKLPEVKSGFVRGLTDRTLRFRFGMAIGSFVTFLLCGAKNQSLQAQRFRLRPFGRGMFPTFVWSSAANRLPPASVIGFEAALIVCVVAVGCTAIMTMFAIRDLGWLS